MRFQIANVVEEAAAAAASCVMDLQMCCGDFSVNLIDIYDG
jgi:hypothetical protein